MSYKISPHRLNHDTKLTTYLPPHSCTAPQVPWSQVLVAQFSWSGNLAVTPCAGLWASHLCHHPPYLLESGWDVGLASNHSLQPRCPMILSHKSVAPVLLSLSLSFAGLGKQEVILGSPNIWR